MKDALREIVDFHALERVDTFIGAKQTSICSFFLTTLFSYIIIIVFT